MKSIEITRIKNKVAELIVKASFELPADIIGAIKYSLDAETGKSAKEVLRLILENADSAKSQKLPLCQDCGNTYINLKIGPGICIAQSGELQKHVDDAVAYAYSKNYLRKSIVTDPLYSRANTGYNTPALITIELVKESGLKIEVSLKGGGSENCSYLKMQNPSINENDIMKLVVDLVRANVTKCCPPVILGIGIGGTASVVTKMARQAAFRDLGISSSDKRYQILEQKILEAVNNTGIGPQGLGGMTTAIGCNIEFAPCHIATLPVAVFIQCHSLRRASSKISPP
jgi:fumarate hydratase subunit alpha